MSTNSDVLRTIPLFRGMTDQSIETISHLAVPASFDAGAVLVRQGEPGDSFIVLIAGQASVEMDGRFIRSLDAGDFLGEIALIDGGPRTATVSATSAVEVLTVDRAGFGRLMAEFPVVRLDLVSALTQRLRERAPTPTD